MSGQDWGSDWRAADTPEKRAELVEQIQFRKAQKAARELERLTQYAALASRACPDCGEPLNSLRRKVCPPCRLKRKRIRARRR